MARVNVDNVLYSNPTKRLIIAREAMKDNYTKETANEYMGTYIGQPLSFVLENSRMIFSEPYYGYDFYKKVITESALVFPEYENELEKVMTFIEENSDSMGTEQRIMYEDLQQILTDKRDEYKNSNIVYKYALENGLDESVLPSLADKIYDAENFAKFESSDRYTELCESIQSIFCESVKSPDTYLLFAPYIHESIEDIDVLDALNTYMPETFDDTNGWVTATHSMLFANKLSKDSPYVEAVNSFTNPMKKIVFETYMNTDLNDFVHNLTVQTVTEDEVPNIYENASDAVEGLFDNELMFEAMIENSQEIGEQVKSVIDGLNESVTMLMYLEYANADDTTAVAEGYDFFSEGTTIEDCLDQLITEATTPVVPKKNTKSNKSLAQQVMDEEDEEDEKSSTNTTSTNTSKPVNPKKEQDWTQRVQNKAMDIEAKQTKSLAESKRKGTNLKNAAKAITNIPMNIINSIKNVAKSWETADDNRRKKYMTQPGYRKTIFRNLRLALTYGALGHIKLLFIPAFAIVRHFSKTKDRRIRNELMRELETDLKITREKINDANANNDQKEKYQLMRIESQIEAELVRVKVNSKT